MRIFVHLKKVCQTELKNINNPKSNKKREKEEGIKVVMVWWQEREDC